MNSKKIDDSFISYAADVLGDTNQGLSGSQIVKYCNSYAVDFNVNIPITSSDFGKFGSIVPNKRTALYKNLVVFNGIQQFTIIKELCELSDFNDNENVVKLKSILFKRYSEFATSSLYVDDHQPTGWERVDRSIIEMKNRLEVAVTEEQFQAIGMIGRETLITIAQQVFDAEKHPTIDGTTASKTDAKRMLEAFLNFELKDTAEKARKFARASVDLGNQLTHDRGATKKEATMCIISINSIAALIKTIYDSQ
ncbi:hypothetical protein JMA_26780 [Jeotgalibacillus malaysiensis]|uniref:Uncharacterized protein n=1 Tax=Jeotgalibacillus malaysiensis TaxID=1508404 RepID=A0A0B5AP00_9BACL|nr:hypothetical protein [Jeotgalibacillus malaysiensis]AJD91995.1 hypothetical protein JMA_26780 [Jeotgalibacillus malaysiensis]